MFVNNNGFDNESDDIFDYYTSDNSHDENDEKINENSNSNNNNTQLPIFNGTSPQLTTINDTQNDIGIYKRKKKERKEKQLFKDKCIKSMREYDKMFYNLWGDENIIYSTDEEDNNELNNNNNKTEFNNNNNLSDSDSYNNNMFEILQNTLLNKWEPSQTAKDTFINEIFDHKQITNNSICVKVHSNILTISKKFIYNDQYFNHIYQQSMWDNKNTNINTNNNNNNESSDDDDDDEKDQIGVDGWERIDDETFYLTKPQNFEKRIYLSNWNNNNSNSNSNNNIKHKRRKRISYLSEDESDQSEENKNRNNNNNNNISDNGNVLYNGLDAFVNNKSMSASGSGSGRDIIYNNSINEIKEKEEVIQISKWKTTDEAEVKRQRKSRYNKQVEIVKKFGQPICNGDTIGIGINFHQRTLFITVNGKLINDKKYNKQMIFRDIFINEPLYIFGILKHYGNQLHFNFGQEKFMFNLEKYFSCEYIKMIKRNHNYINKFTHSSNINKKLLDSSILDHCIYEGYEVTAKKLICKLFGEENGNKLISHLMICNDIFSTMNIRRSIKKYIENGNMEQVKCNIKKLKINYFSMKYPVAWFQILRQELIELLRVNKINEAKHLYENELLGFESFLLSDFNPHRLNLDDKNKKILQNEINILGTLLINCSYNNGFDINNILIEYTYLFDVNRRYRLRDIIHNLIYQCVKERENKRIDSLYNTSVFDEVNGNNERKLKMYDSQLNLFLKHLCTVYDMYKTNFGNYLENIRFV